MAELKASHRKVYDELLEVGIEKFSRAYNPKKRIKGMPINAFCSDFFTTGWLQHAYVMNVNHVPKPKTWDILDAVRDCIVLLWEIKKQSGRPKKSKTPYAGEKRKLQTCLNCGQKGYTKKSCLKPLSTTTKPAKKSTYLQHLQERRT
ncbi:hypothetical protein Dsin_018552 [Dipteronia sinensis]|uniref:CCHC-type domain-containing protein n=1 Tax=Dipteronia sinensis TaxID=43782 RepID=A0AAE0E262_9ROSI|nr:hypothetical protein Dsin_018552 [Dipteronia sinensis]